VQIIGQLLNFWLKLISTNLNTRIKQYNSIARGMKLVLMYNAELSFRKTAQIFRQNGFLTILHFKTMLAPKHIVQHIANYGDGKITSTTTSDQQNRRVV